MAKINQSDLAIGRIRGIAFLMAVAFFALGAHIWSLQVVSGQDAVNELDNQSLRTVRTPGARGRILDRYGKILVDNRPSYCISILMEELVSFGKRREVIDATDDVLDRLSAKLGIPRVISRREIGVHMTRRALLPLIAWRDIEPVAVARFSENHEAFPGVHIYVEPVRVYPNGKTAGHVLGYVKRDNPDERNEMEENHLIPDVTGATGIERVMNDLLKGTYGRQVLRINALGFKYREEESELEPTAGQDLYLTLDIEMQKIAEARLRGLGGRPAAIVLADVRNGEVLVMASAPSFDPNSFVPRISTAEWAKLRDNPMHPMINRAVAHYPPGSVFKPLVAMTALQSGAIDSEVEFKCEYVYRIGGARGRDMHCWRKHGHGLVAMRRSLEQSCNIYYFNLIDHVNVQGIWHAADYLGFGHRTGVEVPWEKEGVNPNDAWKRSTGRSRWTKGDSANYVIGQGYLTVSPLQLSRLTAAVANGGKVYRPSLVYAVTNPETGLRERRRSVLVQDLHWKKENLDVVRGGMYDVVHTETGTGRRVRLSSGVRMAGKTGTAETTINGRRGRHAWMTVYAPYENPRYAATMIIEDTQSGGGAMVAPELKALMEGVFSLRGAGS